MSGFWGMDVKQSRLGMHDSECIMNGGAERNGMTPRYSMSYSVGLCNLESTSKGSFCDALNSSNSQSNGFGNSFSAVRGESGGAFSLPSSFPVSVPSPSTPPPATADDRTPVRFFIGPPRN